MEAVRSVEDQARYERSPDCIEKLNRAVSALRTLVVMRHLVNERDDLVASSGEDVVLEYLNGPAWDDAEAALAVIGRPVT